MANIDRVVNDSLSSILVEMLHDVFHRLRLHPKELAVLGVHAVVVAHLRVREMAHGAGEIRFKMEGPTNKTKWFQGSVVEF